MGRVTHAPDVEALAAVWDRAVFIEPSPALAETVARIGPSAPLRSLNAIHVHPPL